MAKKLIVFSGWVLLICLALVFCFALGVWFEWHTLTIFMFWIGILFTATFFWVFSRALLQFIRGGKYYLFFHHYRLSRFERVMRVHWSSGARLLKQLKKEKKVIPWYFFIGEGCGKTSLLKGTVSQVFSDDAEGEDILPTRTVRWFFFKTVCFLELSHYFSCEKPAYKRAFLKLLKWCKKTHYPSGIVIAVSMEELINNSHEEIIGSARRTRPVVDKMIRTLKTQLPIYFLILQSDKFPSFNIWVNSLSLSQKNQAFGFYWPQYPNIDDKDDPSFLQFMNTINDGMSLVRLSQPRVSEFTPEHSSLIDFPENFLRLKGPLSLYLSSLCESNLYFTPVQVAGIFFTYSELEPAHTNGKRISHFIQELVSYFFPSFSQSRDLRWGPKEKVKRVLLSIIFISLLSYLLYTCFRSVELMKRESGELTSENLARQMSRIESSYDSPWNYIPFRTILDDSYKRTLDILVKNVAPKLSDSSQQTTEYKRVFEISPPDKKREMIIDLAQAIITFTAMRNDNTLSELMQRPVVPAKLELFSYAQSNDRLALLAVQRMYMQESTGAERLDGLRHLLTALINNTPVSQWLTAPGDGLENFNANTYWDNLPISVTLPGIWTKEGEKQVKEWVNLINEAEGSDNFDLIPAPIKLINIWPKLRQDAWYEFIVDIIRSQDKRGITNLSQSQLFAMSQGNSPAIQFTHYVIEQLDSIATDNEEPWLHELRRLHQLELESSQNSATQRMHIVDDKLRKMLSSFLTGIPISERTTLAAQVRIWTLWRESLSRAATEALNHSVPGPELTQMLFTIQPGEKKSNDIDILFKNIDSLRNIMSSAVNPPGTDIVWSLYSVDAQGLLFHAMNQTSCWLNQRWSSDVLWPLRSQKNVQDYDSQQSVASQYIADYVRGPAQGFIKINDRGVYPAEFRGTALSITPAYINLTKHFLDPNDLLAVPARPSTSDKDLLALTSDKIAQLQAQKKELELQTFSINLVSEPASIPSGSWIKPTGIRLSVMCGNVNQTLDSINFAERKMFTWSPGACQGVILDVKFPETSVRFNNDGYGAWPTFLSRFQNNVAFFNANEFIDDSGVLNMAGTDNIMIRLKISDKKPLLDAWAKWQDLDKQITDLSSQAQTLTSAIQMNEQYSPLRGHLSSIPENVALCR